MSRNSTSNTPASKQCLHCGNEFTRETIAIPENFKRQKFCSHPCFGKYRTANVKYDPEKFWAKVDKSGGEDACWPYTGYVTPEGYGWAWTGLPKGQQQTHGAHRQAWINTHGPIQQEQVICHHCDNPTCCNPKHLFKGTIADNSLDMCRKDRQNSKLTAEQVREILKRATGERGEAQRLAIEYGVAPGTIRGVVRGTYWKHIPRGN